MFQSRSSVRSWKPGQTRRRRRREGSDGREADARIDRGRDEQGRIKQSRREARWAREKQNPPSWMIPHR